MKIDLTPIIQAIIALCGALITYKLIPYLKRKTTAAQYEMLERVAAVAAKAAEQIYEYGDNANKIDYAVKYTLETLDNFGYKVDIQTVKGAVEKSVYEIPKIAELVSIDEE